MTKWGLLERDKYQSFYCIQGRSQPVFAGKPWDHFICTVASFSEIEKKDEKRGENRKSRKPGDHFICSVASFSHMREIG